MFSISDFFKKYPWAPNFLLRLIGIIIMLIIYFVNFTDIAKELLQSVREIRANTNSLALNLKDNTNGGITVIVGVNPKEAKENLAFVYDNNDLNLKPGDVILLKNFTDNTFQSSLRFIVQKSFPLPENRTNASIFISDEAARRLGFEDYKKRGTISVKMLRVPVKE
jgi:hypothetical protein